jgi:molecular chaperone DnaK
MIIPCCQMDDNGLILCEVAIPDLGAHLTHKSFYVPQVGQERFDGDDGELLAANKLADAQGALNQTREALGSMSQLDALDRRLSRQRELLTNWHDAEARRSVTEEALHVQQELARLRDAPEHRRAALLDEIERIEDGVANVVEGLDAETVQRLNTLLSSAREELSNGNWKKVRDLVEQAQSNFQKVLFEQPSFILAVFEDVARERHVALDKDLHDQLVAEGHAATEKGDIDTVREVIGKILRNRMPNESSSKGVAALAGLLK